MTATGVTLPARSAWSRVSVGSSAVAAADRDALGTTARIVVWPPENLPRLLAVVDGELALLDEQASRFRADSEISALHGAGAGTYLISEGLAEAVGIALAAASWTGGLADPTVGAALISLGYDRDFAAIEPGQGAPPPDRVQVPGWQAVLLVGRELTIPAGVRLDLGATAKGLGADRAARAAYAAAGGGGVLVSLGGDLAVAGQPTAGGWPVLVADEHRQVRAARNLAARRPSGETQGPARNTAGPARNTAGPARNRGGGAAGPARPPAQADPVITQQVRLGRGGLATSSVTCRQWERAGKVMHHLIDPRTGLPADGPWRTASVAAASCAQANAASTAAIIAGDDAVGWLSAQGLPARLTGRDGRVVRTGGWPEADDGRIDPPTAPPFAARADLAAHADAEQP